MINDIEDPKIYFFDSFLPTMQTNEIKAVNGYSETALGEIVLSTGVGQGGYDHLYYDSKIFNPKFSDLIFKLRISDLTDVKAFIGFRTNITAPDINMVESHVGILIWQVAGATKIYFSSADGVNQQKVELEGLNMEDVYEFKISFDKLYFKPLPQVESYLGMPTIKRVERVYTLLQQNSTWTAEDQVHWIALYIENTTNAERLIYLNRIIYKEEYAD